MDNGLPSKLDGRVETVNVDGDEDWHHTPSSPGLCRRLDFPRPLILARPWSY